MFHRRTLKFDCIIGINRLKEKFTEKQRFPMLLKIFWFCWREKKSDSEYLSYNLMLNSGKKSFFYSNSCVVRKKILNKNKNNSPLCKLNGRSLAHCHLAAVNIWAHVDWYNAAISNWGNQILVTESTLNVGWGCWTQFWKGGHHSSQVWWLNLA